MIEFDWTLSLPFLFSLAAMVYAHFRTRRQDVEERFKAGSRRMDDLEVRLSKLELRLETMPGREDLHSMQVTLTEMAGSLSTMTERLRSQNELMLRLETVVTRHEDHLWDKSK